MQYCLTAKGGEGAFWDGHTREEDFLGAAKVSSVHWLALPRALRHLGAKKQVRPTGLNVRLPRMLWIFLERMPIMAPLF